MALTNIGLLTSQARKEDEFYTLYEDVEQTCMMYEKEFNDKVVYLNTDNYLHSNIYKFFKKNFRRFQLKKLIATCYSNKQINSNNRAYKAVCEDDLGQIVETVTVLKGNGDFASHECLKLLNTADIVVTNPPYSIFVDFMACLKSHHKKFLCMSNFNTLLASNISQSIIDKELYPASPVRVRRFEIPKKYAINRGIEPDRDGKYYERLGNSIWVTNLKLGDYKANLRLVKSYSLNKESYRFYDNNPDILNVDKVKDIPYDYYGKIGVPVSFLYNYFGEIRDLYELVGILSHGTDNKYDLGEPRIDGKRLYKRLVIQRRQV